MAQENDTVRLAGQAASLSSELYNLQDKCQQDTTAGEISSIADELARLSTTLWKLNDAINSDPAQYTDAFNEDLKEITTELTCILEEISECCASLMAGSNVSAVSWFFRKGRVAKLLKHLEALKGTLMVMRTVLWHGKDYGTHTSDRLAEANPHTMHEDRVILESVLATNRNAILDLHNLAGSIGDKAIENSNSLKRKPSRAGDHHRELSESTGVDIPPIPDVLPPSAAAVASEKAVRAENEAEVGLKRTFSKRGVRLGVHMSILDLSAHEAPANLQQKWLQQAHLRRQVGHGQPRDRRGLTALPELSRISEVDTAAGSSTNLSMPPNQSQAAIVAIQEERESPAPVSKVPDNTPVPAFQQNERSPLSKRQKSSVGSKLRHVISKISITNLRTPSKSRSQLVRQELGAVDVLENAKEEDCSNASSCSIPNTPSTGRSKRRLDKDNRHGKTLFELLRQKFEKSPTKESCVNYGLKYDED